MFDYYEMLHARNGRRDNGSCMRLAAFNVQGYKKVGLDLSKEAFKSLLEYAEHSYWALSDEEQKAHIDPNEANPMDRLNQKALYLARIAPEFLEQTGSPYIVDFIPEGKDQKSVRRMGYQNTDGLYVKTESESPQKGFLSIFKMAFKKDFIHHTNSAREALQKESTDPKVYEDRVKAFMNKQGVSGAKHEAGGLGITS